ncbi:MAG: hypothetical protein KatS3mg110_0951 [Pirellulaceae bacterium]|nr:MAG: hypothetical protein KatS3mg110_0951 [Pirellulaceae bacterium]
MNFGDIPARKLFIRIRRTDGLATPISEGPALSIAPCPTRPGEFELRLKDCVIFVTPVSDSDNQRLMRELAGGSALLAQLANPAADRSVELQIALFAGECINMEAVEIGVDEYVEEKYSTIVRKPVSRRNLRDELATRFCYNHGGQPYFFFFAGPALEGALLEDEQETNIEHHDKNGESLDGHQVSNGDQTNDFPNTSSSHPQPSRKNSFCIVGNGIRLVATENIRPDGKSIYFATRLTKVKAEPDRAVRLARGRLTFSDWTKAEQIRILTKAQIQALTSDTGSYLNRWDEFMQIEGELLLARARKIDALQYSDMTPNRDGTVSVRITHASDTAMQALAEGEAESVELVEELPEYLRNPALTFTEFIRSVEKETFLSGRGRPLKEARPHYDVVHYEKKAGFLTLRTENLPPTGTLILSLVGHVAQIKRRMFARKAILEGRAANPQLGLLIEEKGRIAPTRSSTKIKPLTAFVIRKVFRNPPTERQREAIQVALNTPDIALIQGPPGTGKTTVIAAIIERLNEVADKRSQNAKGSVLLTGVQHDAVENMIQRMSLNGLPIPKFGKRPGSEDDDFGTFERQLLDWCREKATALRARNPCLAYIEEEVQLKNLCRQYLKAPTRAMALNIAKRIASLNVLMVGDECARRAANLVKRLSQEEQLNAESVSWLGAVRRLRHRPEAFADDGPERAADALEDLRDFLQPDEYSLLDKASRWHNENGLPPFLSDLAALKKQLLYRFTAPPVFRVEKLNDEIVSLVEEVSARLRTAGISAKDAKSAALAEFLIELETNPYGMMEAVSDYAYAFAATCQQSVNRLMQRQKGIEAEDSVSEFQKIEYDYVIVDEAARATPPDLMVAMAQGKRIILVGDHRQLPHIITEAVAQQMEAGKSGAQEADWIKKSMFEYLFTERLKALEEKDGIRRRVTLDKQYRMHPLLGDFISRNFYERFDPSERFESGRPESDFTHNLPDTDGRPALWLEVPAAKGKPRREGTSWIRQAEVTAIVDRLRIWMTSAEGHELSFGVITFYKAQAELIKRHLEPLDCDQNRLRIGTVDSFQGMEFDVVLLSVVRTMPDNWKPHSEDEEIDARRLYGHLCLYNRLNVAMSRQRKLLAVIGDPDLLQNKLAREYIPALVDFYTLCRTQGRVLACR